jgi:hypothetical protein
MPTPPDVENLTIGKGILSIAEFSGGVPGAYSDLGEVPSIELEQQVERLPYLSSRSGTKLKVKNPVVMTQYNLTFTMSEFATQNLQKYLMASLSAGALQMFGNIEGEFALRFVEDNPSGPNRIWNFWKGTLIPNGSLQLIGEDWRAMSLRFEGLADTVNHAASPYSDNELSSSSSTSSSSSSSSSSA